MRFNFSKWSVFNIFWMLSFLFLFNYFAFYIDQFNTTIRIFAKTGEFHNERNFDANGIPVSKSPGKEDFISPFYVIHYGLIYSNSANGFGKHWELDPSMKYWNVEPPTFGDRENLRRFKFAADWIVSNLQEINNNSHLIYNFDWPYKGYENDELKGPWWSGLTDGYAIILLLRAGDFFRDEKYFIAAKSLYKSVLTPISNGGSLNELNGCPWIEEYVDPKAKSEKMSFVFNGMIYATKGIEAFEESAGALGESKKLYECIERNVIKFDLNKWSYYDQIGNSSNIKYHRISSVLLDDLVASKRIKMTEDIARILPSWNIGVSNSGLFYIMKGPRSMAYWNFLVLLLLILLIPSICRIGYTRFSKKKNENI